MLDSLIVFVVSLLIGALGIHVGASVVANVSDYRYAVITALIGAIVWAILGWILLIGPVLALIAYLAVVNYRYPGGWLDAIKITIVAWLSVVVVLFLINLVAGTSFGALGVPGA